MTPFARTDRSVLGRWWWTVDRWTLAALMALLGIGVVLIVSGSPGRDRGAGRHQPGRARLCLCRVRPCAKPHRPLPKPGDRRHLPDRQVDCRI